MADQSKSTGNDDAVDMGDEDLRLAMAVLKVLNPGLKAADVSEELAAVARKHGLDESYTKERFDKMQASYAEYKRKDPPKDIVILKRQGRGQHPEASQEDDENADNSDAPRPVLTASQTTGTSIPAPHVLHVSRRSRTTARSARAAARLARDEGHTFGENSSSAAPAPASPLAPPSVPATITAPKRKRDTPAPCDAKRSKGDVADDGNGDGNQPEQEDS